MRVSIDSEICQGHLRCLDLAPALFDSDDMGHGFVNGDGTVPTEHEDAAREAFLSCPERAVLLEE